MRKCVAKTRMRRDSRVTSLTLTITPTCTMEYIPRYPQPFTLSEVTGLDVSVITEGF